MRSLPWGLIRPRELNNFNYTMTASPVYLRPRLDRYGTFRDLTQVSLNLGAFALNSNVLSGSAASCDCLPGEGPPVGGSRS